MIYFHVCGTTFLVQWIRGLRLRVTMRAGYGRPATEEPATRYYSGPEPAAA